MPSVEDRFRSLSRTGSPDLWREIEVREPRSAPDEPRGRRLLAGTLAFLIAAAGFGFAALTFGGSEPPAVRGTSGISGAAAANGPILFRVGGEGGTTWYSVMPDGSDRHVVFEGEPMPIANIAWSPDGSRIAFQNPIAEERGIFVAEADGSDPVRLTDGAHDGWPSWSPDGTRILFSRTTTDPGVEQCVPGTPHEFRCPTDIYVMDADGSEVTRLTDAPAGEFMPRWSPDGTMIAFVREGDLLAGTYEAVYTMRPDGTDVRQLSSGNRGSDFWPSWSPDGTQIVFAAIRAEDWGIWVVDADGSNEHMVFGGTGAGYVDDPVWSPDGASIAFIGNLTVDDYSPDDALYVMRPDGSGVTPIAEAPDGIAGDLAWQPIPAAAETVEPTPVPTSAEVVDTFEVGVDVRSVVYGEGSVWVATSNNDGSFGGRIVRIDPVTHDVQAEIPVDVIPNWEVGGGGMVVADGSLWVTGSLEAPGNFDDPGGGADAGVIRIDASTDEVAQTFPLGGAHGADLTFLNGELWVLLFGDETVDNTMEVVRVDATTGDVLDRGALETNWAHAIIAVGGRLMVIEGGSDVVNVGGRMTSIDPASSSVTARTPIPSGASVFGAVSWRGQSWASFEDGFARFDPITAEVIERSPRLDPSRFAVGNGFIEADDRGIWFLGYNGQTGAPARRLDVFDPDTGTVTELVELTEGNPIDMAVTPDAVWVLNYAGMLTHIALI